ncbi:hypothetical protein [Paraflavitalea speifideaquila]|uniref:hypothetical protein n=1 Tax=Paraflavitalea speifideaquila TaxID=3076558 RepID=UPI0028EF9349|nr:hypothetical protein [Paraflavitalea speifideiaquila]
MSIHHPKTKTGQDKKGLAGKQEKVAPPQHTDQHQQHQPPVDQQQKKGKELDQYPDQQPKKGKAFDEGLSNNSNTQTGTANSGYDEKNPKRPGGKQQEHPKVTNQENDITNTEEQDKWEDEPVDEQAGNSTHRTDPEIDSPIPDAEKTEKKIPKGNSL